MDKTTTVPAPAAKEHIVWLDVVRFAAMFTVVCCHCADPFNFYAGDPTADLESIKFWGAAWGAALRPCVPLFVMITGALLLPVKDQAGPFYRKRISRVLWPFLIWSVLYNLFPWILGLLGFRPETLLTFFPYSGEDVARQSLSVSLGYIAQIPVNFSVVDVHMWYIYLLIGLYLFMPVFSAWVEKASEKAKLWFLAAWGVTLFVPYIREFAGEYIWGACSWNEFYMLYYFAGFNGYLLLGHYLRHHDWPLSKILAVGIPMFAAGFAITFFGFRHITSLPEYTPEQMELFLYYCSPNVVMMTVPVFLICKHIKVTSTTVKKMLGRIRSIVAADRRNQKTDRKNSQIPGRVKSFRQNWQIGFCVYKNGQRIRKCQTVHSHNISSYFQIIIYPTVI